MQELDMAAPGSELFPEGQEGQYNSYTDVNMGQSVDDPLNTGVSADVADHALSDKEMNFKALREQANKLKEEREYWKGQAEAYNKTLSKPEPEPQAPAYESLDWDDSKDVRKAFDSLKQENQRIRHEMNDAITAMSTKQKHGDWDRMVADHVPELTSKNPIFAEMIQNASNPYEAAYLLAELNARGGHAQAQAPVSNQMSLNGQRAIANAQKPTSLASIGGGGTLNAADYYANMSDADFHKIAARNMANI
jgi:hypothetical protein